MSASLMWFVGNQQPSIEETIEIDGAPVDLTNATVKFKMRAVGSAVLKVDSAVSNTPGVDGVVRYDWATADVDTAGQYLVWWEVTESSKTQDLAESVIEFRAHSNANVYVELEQFKSSAEMTGHNFADQDMRKALASASRVVDYLTGRRFYPDTDTAQVRYYSPVLPDELWIDDLITLTSLKTAPSSDRAFTETWSATDYMLEPVNALDENQPWTSLRIAPASVYAWPTYTNSVEVTGKFGWSTPPEGVQLATALLAAQLVKRIREAPFGVLGGFEEAVRIGRFDPQLDLLLAPYTKFRLGLA